MTVTYPIVIENTAEGYYAECPFIQGVYAEGKTESEAKANLEDVLKLTLADMHARGEKISINSNFIPSITVSSLSFSI